MVVQTCGVAVMYQEQQVGERVLSTWRLWTISTISYGRAPVEPRAICTLRVLPSETFLPCPVMRVDTQVTPAVRIMQVHERLHALGRGYILYQ